MPHSLTLELPDSVYARLERAARSVGRSVQDVAVDNLAGEPIAVEPNLPEPYRSEILGMATWSTEALHCAVKEIVPHNRQRRLRSLLRLSQSSGLSDREREALSTLSEEADRVLLRKARAAALLRSRGEPVPSPDSLPTPQ